jgi:Holliday junction resolvase
VSHYAKGAAFERQLRDLLRARGLVVVRSASSGVDGLSPDLVVLSSRKKFAVECKAWKHGPSIEKPKFAVMREWQAAAGVPVFVAWKAPRREWKFFPLDAMRETGMAFVLGDKDWSMGLTLDVVLGLRC